MLHCQVCKKKTISVNVVLALANCHKADILDGEGIRHEIVAFVQAVCNGKSDGYIEENIMAAISGVIEEIYHGLNDGGECAKGNTMILLDCSRAV